MVIGYNGPAIAGMAVVGLLAAVSRVIGLRDGICRFDQLGSCARCEAFPIQFQGIGQKMVLGLELDQALLASLNLMDELFTLSFDSKTKSL